MSFLTEDELSSLKVERMIVHVVDGKTDFVKQPEMPVDGATHLEFFLERIADAAVSGVHRFEDESRIKSLLEQMTSGKLGFEAGGQELARIFAKDHVSSSSAGAFFVFQLGVIDPDVRLYSLIKYDYREAICPTSAPMRQNWFN